MKLKTKQMKLKNGKKKTKRLKIMKQKNTYMIFNNIKNKDFW